jgi:hypothetical protein
MGSLLFALAVTAIIIAPLIGLLWGPGRLIFYRIRGLDLSPRVDLRKQPITDDMKIELPAQSLLTRKPSKGGVPDPCVCIQGADYRVTRVGDWRYLVTERRESRRVGFFEIVADTDHAEIVSEPDEPANQFLLIRIAVEASRTRA